MADDPVRYLQQDDTIIVNSVTYTLIADPIGIRDERYPYGPAHVVVLCARTEEE
jgi:hypothetical protein